jgi:glycosyltransferase involved in cell wall biosynthesis
MTRAVHQFVPGLARRDGVGDQTLAWRTIFREAGYESEIFAGVVTAADRDDGILPLAAYPTDGRALLIYHHAIGNDFAGVVSRLPGPMVLDYHNLTPARFFPGNPVMQHYVRLGLRQVRFFRDRVIGAICASTFSADELRGAGYRNPVIIPSSFSLSRLHRRAVERQDGVEGEPLILSVGRGAANKRQDHVLHAFEHFALRFAPAARLALVGDLYADFAWGQRLVEQVHRSPLRDQIECPGSVTDDELAGYYSSARLYLSMSEHEGFCIPPLESFGCGVPVLAYRTPAVAETMRGAGVLFTRKSWDEIAALMAELCFDADLRQRVVTAQRQRLEQPDLRDARAQLLAAIETWLPGSASAPARPHPHRADAELRLGLIAPLDPSSELVSCTRALLRAFEADDVSLPLLADAYGVQSGLESPHVERIVSGRAEAFVSAAIERRLNAVHIALQPTSSTDPRAIGQVIDGLRAADMRVALTVHTPPLSDGEPLRRLADSAAALARCDALFVHRRADAERLRAVGLTTCRILPYGVPAYAELDRGALLSDLGLSGRRVVTCLAQPTSFGGLRESIEAVYLLQPKYPDVLLLALAPMWLQSSQWYVRACRERVEHLGLSGCILFFDRPMSEAMTETLLSAAELALVPGTENGGEVPLSLRLPLAAGRATIAGRWLLPDGADDAVGDLGAAAPQSIARAIADLLDDDARRARSEAAARRFARQHAWAHVKAAYLEAFGGTSHWDHERLAGPLVR